MTEIPLPFYPFHLWFSHVYYEIVAVNEIPLPFYPFQSGLPSVVRPGTAWQRSRVDWSCPGGFSNPSKKWRVRLDGRSRVHVSPAVMRAGGAGCRVLISLRDRFSNVSVNTFTPGPCDTKLLAVRAKRR
eukprot:COSAG01_NODE_11360_length_1946_cov_1.406368_1_plen_129_part_00